MHFLGETSCVESVVLNGVVLGSPVSRAGDLKHDGDFAGPSQCQYGVRVWDHSDPPSLSDSQLLSNPNFTVPDGQRRALDWAPFGDGYTRLDAPTCRMFKQSCIRVTNSVPGREAGASQLWLHPEGTPYPRRLAISGWVRAENISGGAADATLSIYCDIAYEDGDHYWGATAAAQPGTHNYTRYVRFISLTKPVRSINTVALLRGRTGTAWFDTLSVTVIDVFAAVLPLQNHTDDTGLTSRLPKRGNHRKENNAAGPVDEPISSVSFSGRLSQLPDPPAFITADITAYTHHLAIEANISTRSPSTTNLNGHPSPIFEAKISNEGSISAQATHCLTIELALPINGSGWAISETPDHMRTLQQSEGAVGPGIIMDNLPQPLDSYPLFTLVNTQFSVALALALPMTRHDVVRACRIVFLPTDNSSAGT